jgi:hypothetical protein
VLRALLPAPDSFAGSLGVVLGTAGLCVAVLTLLGRRLGIREIDDLMVRVRARLRR